MTETLVSLLSTIATVFYLQTGAYVLWKSPSTQLNRWFFLFTLTLALWSSGLIIHDQNFEQFDGFPLFWLSISGAMLFPPVMYRFFSIQTGFPRIRRIGLWIFRVKFIISICLLIFVITGGSFAGKRLIHGSVVAGSPFFYFGLAYLIFLSVTIFSVIRQLLLWRLNLSHPSEKFKFNFIFITLTVTILITLLVDILLPLTGLIPNLNIAHFFGVIWVASMAYGILRLRFFSLTPELASERILEHSRLVVFFCSTKGIVVYTNRFTARLLQTPRKDIVGKPVSDFLSNKAMIEELIETVGKNGKPKQVDTVLCSEKEEPIDVNLSISVIYDSFEDRLGIVVFGQDNRETVALRREIENRKQIAQQLVAVSAELETRIVERTEKLATLHKELQINLTERLIAEEKIKADISEKEVLINEIYSRVMQNMELFIFILNIDENPTDDTRLPAKLLFRKLAQRIRTMLLVHQNLYHSTTYSQVDFSSFLQSLVKEICKLHPSSGKLKFNIKVQDILIDFKQAIPLGIIINELLDNAIWHAFDFENRNAAPKVKPLVSIHLSLKNKRFNLTVKDNGVGLPENFQITSFNTNGLPLVEILTRDQLNGEFQILSKNGTSVFVSFPEE